MAQNKRDLAAAKLQEAILQKRLNKINNKYDAVDPNNEKLRRSPSAEIDSEEKILAPSYRGRGIAAARDLERNYSNAKSLVRQIKINTVGSLGKMRLNTAETELNSMVQDWFNGSYAKNCDARGDNHLTDFYKLALISTLREGDVVAVFDDFLFDDGKLWFFEADQMVEIIESEWNAQTDWVEVKNGKTIPLQQSQGVIYDSYGRVIAYAVTGNSRGKQTVPLADAMIVPRGSAKHMMMPWRFNQLRGSADFLTIIGDMEDNYEMRAKELQTAKVASSMAGIVKKKDGIEGSLMSMGLDPDKIIEDDTDSGEQVANAPVYDRLGHLTGGHMEYLADDDEFEFLKIDRPNLDTASFHDFMLQSSGSALGLAKAYSKLEADRSYTAFRGEMVMSWETFKDYQKWLERRLADWVAVKAITYAIRKKTLPRLPTGWEDKVSWTWPTMPQVDPVKENKGKETGLQNGLTDYSELLGPDWKKRMEALAEQKEYAEGLGLNLTSFNEDIQEITTEDTQISAKNGELFTLNGELYEMTVNGLVKCQK